MQPSVAPAALPLSSRPWFVVSVVLWGTGGVMLLVAQGILRLYPLALEPIIEGTLTATQWLIYLAWVVFNTFVEGYRGFQKGFSPRVVARALHLARRPRLWLLVLAPLYCMGLVHATRRRLISSWALLIGIVSVVVLVRNFEQPWRGIIDGGVVVGLTYGLIVLGVCLVRGLAGRTFNVDPDLPSELQADS